MNSKKRMAVPAVIAAAILGLAGWLYPTLTDKPEPTVPGKNAVVLRVIDGDTLKIKYEGKTERLRMIGIDTPESVHKDESRNVPEGKVASDYTKQQLEGKTIRVETDVEPRDHYGRLLGYVYLDGKMFNKTLLQLGYARLDTVPPNVKYEADFVKLQQQAREHNVGFWEGKQFAKSRKR